jgi:Na+/H+-dicarboxylate symporter
MKRVLQWYLKTSLLLRILVCFVVGSAIGCVIWYISSVTGRPVAEALDPYISPFGTLFVQMLKMIVIPVIFFSLVVGTASLPITKFGRVGAKTIGWYFTTSIFAAMAGIGLALIFNPGAGADLTAWDAYTEASAVQGEAMATDTSVLGALSQVLFNLFQNPFESLATGNFLPLIVFSILFGLGIRVGIEAAGDPKRVARLEALQDTLEACRDAVFVMVGWILEYSPIGVLALSIMNFGLYGTTIVGPYVSITVGVLLGIGVMVFVIYPLFLWVLTRRNPFRVLGRIQEAMITGLITRSSAATLPVTLKVAEEELHVRNELASFSLPLGATINMDGVCVHLPMFAVLAANMFGMPMDLGTLTTLLVTTVLVSIGTGGVPGGSMMLLFIILETMGLAEPQVAVVVGLAIAIDAIIDMFVTMNNVTGDLVCTYTVACNEGLIDGES